MNADELFVTGRQIVAARERGHDTDALAQKWSARLREAIHELDADERDRLFDFEYAVWNTPDAEFMAVNGTALNEAWKRNDKRQAVRVYRERRRKLFYEGA